MKRLYVLFLVVFTLLASCLPQPPEDKQEYRIHGTCTLYLDPSLVENPSFMDVTFDKEIYATSEEAHSLDKDELCYQDVAEAFVLKDETTIKITVSLLHPYQGEPNPVLD